MSASTRATRDLVVVTGLAAEARIAAGPGIRVVVAGGARTLQLERRLAQEIERGARAVMSFGIAGGLAERLSCGAWLVARSVLTPSGCVRCHAQWTASLRDRLPGAHVVDLAGVDTPAWTASDKRALHRETGAWAVDTESHVAATLAARAGLAFAAFRVVADGAKRSLPAAAAVALAPDGTIRHGKVLGSIARAPAQLPSLVRTARDTAVALRELSRGRRRLGGGLACPDLDELVLDVP
ncbi:MAG TPA: phosphorylase [Casimicrobiaceae bacterium]|nr:phosphorylase [Casimicrobiaceae bacterium]